MVWIPFRGASMNGAGVPVLDVVGVSRTFGRTQAVSQVGFQLAAGQILGLVGPNGAGKSTLLRIVAGLLPADAGEVVVCGVPRAQDPIAARRVVGWVPDKPALFAELNVAEHFDLVADLWDLPEVAAERARLIDVFQLGAHLAKRPDHLSLGLRQRLMLAITFLRSPTVWLLDEPFSGLDPWALRVLRAELRDAAARGAGVVVASHLLELLDELADSVLVLDEGRVRSLGPIEPSAEGGFEQVFFRETRRGA